MDNSLIQAVRTYLLTQSTVTDLVASRIYPLWLPQRSSFDSISPCVSMRIVSSDHVHSLDGPAGIARPRLQVDCWSRTFLEAHNVAEAVRLALQGYSGTSASLEIHVGILESRAEFVEPPKDGSDHSIYHIALDFFIQHVETTS